MKTLDRLLAILAAVLVAGTLAFAHDVGHHAPSVTYEATEYAFSGPTQLETGLVDVRLVNTGAGPHHLQLARLNDGVTPETFFAAAQEEGEAALRYVEFVGGVGMLLPGEAQSVLVDLAKPGTYLALSFVTNEENVPYMALGMALPIDVASGTAATEAPDVDRVVHLIDYEFDIPDEIQAGPQTWEIVNEGPEVHEMALMKLLPGKTMADLEAFIQTESGDMPVAFFGGVQALSVGNRNFVTVDFEPGIYVALCFVPSQEMDGAPHMALGMIKPFTVVGTTAQD